MTARKNVPGLRPPISPRLEDPAVDRVMRDHTRLLVELSTLTTASAKVIPNVILVDATDTPVGHGLGRPPRWVQASCARGAAGLTGGQVIEIRSGTADRNEFVVLRAVGFGATVTVDVLVM